MLKSLTYRNSHREKMVAKRIARDYQKYFSTETVKADLKGKTIRGGLITIIGQITKQLLTIGSTAILARIITPEDYGVIAMVTVVIGFVALFKDLGLSMATIQREMIDHEQISTLFWINATLGLATFLLLCCLSQIIALFYGEERLTWVTVGLSVGFLFSGLSVQHRAILKRQMKFASLLTVDITSFLIGAVAGIVAAIGGLNYWALVIMHSLISFCELICTFALCPWIPQAKINIKKVKQMLGFGLNLTGFSIVNYFSRNADNLLIGKIFGPQTLGIYSKAYSLLLLPLRQINNPIASVAIPALSRLTGTPELYKRYYLGILEKITIITMPGIAIMIVTSDWLIILLLGPQWIEASRIFAVLGLVGLVQPIANTTSWLFISQDRTKEQFKWGIISSILTIISFLAGLPWGAFGIAASYSVSGLIIRTPLLLWLIGRKGLVKTHDFIKILALPSGLTFVVFIILILLRWVTKIQEPIYGILIFTSVGLIITTLILIISPRGKLCIKDFKNIADNLWHLHANK
jgi:PST family polysaccharide transporter